MATPIPDNRARFTIDEIVRATRGTLRGQATEAVGVFSDGRAVKAGSAFVALRGETHDGHAFLAQAQEKGAAVVVVERGRAPANGAAIEVDDTLVAWGELARAHLARWRTKERRVVAITGSAGKTTTKELTAALFGAVAETHRTKGNLNNRIGVPAMIFTLEAETFSVLEMGMSLPGELDAIASIAPPDASIVTNVGVAHAEGVGGREGVMREKGAVYRALREEGIAIVNADDPFVVRAAAGTRAKRIETFGRAESAGYRLVSREPGTVSIARPSGIAHIPFRIPGEAAAIDLTAAIAAQEAVTGRVLPPDAMEAALAGVSLEGRARVLTLVRETLLLDDTYNANPASMRAALDTLREIGRGRRLVAVIGEMKELGPLAEEEHDALGEAIADAGVSLAIGCGGLASRALSRAKARGVEVHPAASTREAADAVPQQIRPGDAILVKGSRSVGAEKVVSAIVAFYPEVLPDSPKSALSEDR